MRIFKFIFPIYLFLQLPEYFKRTEQMELFFSQFVTFEFKLHFLN